MRDREKGNIETVEAKTKEATESQPNEAVTVDLNLTTNTSLCRSLVRPAFH